MYIPSAHNENGSIITLVLLVLMLLSLLGMSTASSVTVNVKIANNIRLQNVAFYNAEAGRVYVSANSSLYGVGNIAPGVPASFSSNASSTFLDNGITFSGDVEYLSSTTPPRGSGYAVGNFRAHRYKLICNGVSPGGKQYPVAASFYRIGF